MRASEYGFFVTVRQLSTRQPMLSGTNQYITSSACSQALVEVPGGEKVDERIYGPLTELPMIFIIGFKKIAISMALFSAIPLERLILQV